MPGNRTDYGTEQTDRAVKRVERRLSSVYMEAQRDIDDKLKDWQERHKKRDARYRQMVAAGKMSKEDYRAWVRGQVFQEKQWQARRAEIDNILLNADRAAQNIVNEGKLGVFAANANYMGYALERDSNIDTGFVLYSEGTVARLIEDDPQILPKPAPGVKKELAFPYYNKLMSSAITQGIVQGETISEIAGRVARTTGESSYKSAMRNARTAYTGAQNAGRIEGLHQAQRLGIKVKKKWLAILDSRTRDTHKDLDGQTQEVDDPFVVDGDEIMFPGDPTAKPALTYNCRCTLTYEYPDYPSTMPRRDAENGQIVADMTYREWEQMKRGEAKEEKSTFEIVKEYDAKIEVLNQAIENSEAEYQDLLFRQMMAFGTPEGDELTKQVNSFGEISASRYNELEKIRDERRRFLMQRGEPEIRRTIGIINGNHSIDDDLWAVNRITADDPRSFNNCGYCSLAYDARRRGIDCKAPYIYGANDTSMSEWWDGFSFQTTGKYDPQEAANAIISAAEQWGPGARGIVAVDHDVGMGHYFQFEVDSDGKCNFVDAQTGIMDARTAFDTASYGSVRYGRTDDKELTKSALFYLEKGGWGRDKYS